MPATHAMLETENQVHLICFADKQSFQSSDSFFSTLAAKKACRALEDPRRSAEQREQYFSTEHSRAHCRFGADVYHLFFNNEKSA